MEYSLQFPHRLDHQNRVQYLPSLIPQNQHILPFSSAVTSTTTTLTSSCMSSLPAMGAGYSSYSQSSVSSLPAVSSTSNQNNEALSPDVLNQVYTIIHREISTILSRNSMATSLQDRSQVPVTCQSLSANQAFWQSNPSHPSFHRHSQEAAPLHDFN